MDRCKKILKTALLEAMIMTAFYDVCIVLFRYRIIGIFTNEPGVVEQAVKRVFVVLTVHFLISLYEISGSALRSMGKSLVPALLTIVGCVGFRVFWILIIFPMFHTMEGIMAVYPASWVVTATLTWTYYFRVRKELYGGVK